MMSETTVTKFELNDEVMYQGVRVRILAKHPHPPPIGTHYTISGDYPGAMRYVSERALARSNIITYFARWLERR